MSVRRHLPPCAVLLAAVLAAACGSNGHSPAAPAAPPTVTTATPFAQPPVPTIVNSAGQLIGSAGGAPGAGTAREIRYRVEAGDTLLAIANRFDTTVAAIVERNSITDPAALRIGTELIIPTSSTVLATATPASTATATAMPSATPTMSPSGERLYRVEAGDTIAAIAVRFGVTTEAITRRNAITNAAGLQVGQELIIPASTLTPTPTATTSPPAATATARPSATPGRTLNYTVQPGDSAFEIAARFGVTVEELAEANNRTVASLSSLQPGDTLLIPAAR